MAIQDHRSLKRGGVRSGRSQRGIAAIELAVSALVLVTFLGAMLQVARALWYYNALAKATGDAAMYLASAPNAELIATGASRAKNIVVLAASGAGVNLPASQVLLICTPLATAPCGGAIMPNHVMVQASYLLTDDLFPAITATEEVNYSTITLISRTTMPRIGYW
jgi:hypothetical protein